MSKVLAIVPCGKLKIWDKNPAHGPAQACDAYAGTLFRLHRQYAESFADRWLILSAKYGFIEPDFEIPEPYNVSFNNKKCGPISTDELRTQVRQQRLSEFSKIVGLGGKEYRKAIESAFEGQNPKLVFPFAGLPIGKLLQAVKRTIQEKQSS